MITILPLLKWQALKKVDTYHLSKKVIIIDIIIILSLIYLELTR